MYLLLHPSISFFPLGCLVSYLLSSAVTSSFGTSVIQYLDFLLDFAFSLNTLLIFDFVSLLSIPVTWISKLLPYYYYYYYYYYYLINLRYHFFPSYVKSDSRIP